MLHVHTIKPSPGSKHRVKRVGRGNASGHGTSSTRGGKGQTARSGGSHGLWKKAFKQQLQQTPKLRGFTSFQVKPAEVYLADLEKSFAAGDTVDLKALQEKNLVSVNDAAAKIISTGDISKKFVITGIACTKSAAAKIQAAGGEIK